MKVTRACLTNVTIRWMCVEEKKWAGERFLIRKKRATIFPANSLSSNHQSRDTWYTYLAMHGLILQRSCWLRVVCSNSGLRNKKKKRRGREKKISPVFLVNVCRLNYIYIYIEVLGKRLAALPTYEGAAPCRCRYT